MATVREGNQRVLLVVDVQVGVMDGAWEAQRVVANVARAVERARAHGVPVVWVQQGDEELVRGTPAYAALDRGYDLTLLKAAHTTGPIEFQDGRVIAAEDIVRELNAVMPWVSYPGRRGEAPCRRRVTHLVPGAGGVVSG